MWVLIPPSSNTQIRVTKYRELTCGSKQWQSSRTQIYLRTFLLNVGKLPQTVVALLCSLSEMQLLAEPHQMEEVCHMEPCDKCIFISTFIMQGGLQAQKSCTQCRKAEECWVFPEFLPFLSKTMEIYVLHTYKQQHCNSVAHLLCLLALCMDSYISNITHFLHTTKPTLQEAKSKGLVGSHPKSPAWSSSKKKPVF